jgi:hypothetical protein
MLVSVSMARELFERPQRPDMFQAIVERVK